MVNQLHIKYKNQSKPPFTVAFFVILNKKTVAMAHWQGYNVFIEAKH